MVKATSVRAYDSSPNFSKKPESKTVNHVATDYFEMGLCLCGCGRPVNVKVPWGRFAKGGVYGATCNETYLKKRQESLMTRTV